MALLSVYCVIKIVRIGFARQRRAGRTEHQSQHRQPAQQGQQTGKRISKQTIDSGSMVAVPRYLVVATGGGGGFVAISYIGGQRGIFLR